MDRPTTEVLVVGAGPTGLLLAGELAAAGVDTTVLERRAEESNLSRAFAVHARTLEILDARGLADDLVRTGAAVGHIQLFENADVDLTRLPSRFPFVLVTPQYHTERLLLERARALGAEIVTGAEATGVRQDPAGVDVDVRTRDGAVHTRRADYLVGTDGVRSTVRHALGLPFRGHPAGPTTAVLADVRLAEPPPDVLTVNAAGNDFAFIAPFGDGWYRIIAFDQRVQLPDSAPVELDEVRDIMRRALGTDFGIHDPRWMSRFHNEERQVPRYRTGRVLLAGDAAHVHSSAGGQGMNTGLQDAANLGWKLAAVVQGRSPDALLDTYQAERHAVGRRVLRLSGGLLRMATLRPRALRAGRGLAGRVVAGVGPLTDRVARGISGIDIAYPAERGAHALTGRRAPDIRLAGSSGGDGTTPTWLYEALRRGRFVLVSPPSEAAGERPIERPSALDTWADRVDLAVAASSTRTMGLVRPDGYVAWASAVADPARRDAALREALARWCGTPVRAAPRQPLRPASRT
jgi:2-polyprenyl-6-methoxyphenol hydroxylase-like FAD-dependent oxidoreductase